MKFSILGPFEAHDADGPVAVGGGQQRKLLAILLLHSNEVVSTDHLVEELWGSNPPSTAGKALQGYVSQIRKRLGAQSLETVGSGYRLRVDADAVDARVFEALLAEARTLDRVPAALTLRRALDLWRGSALAEFAYDDFARGEIERLEELRLSCLERRIDLELALGHHDDLVPELEALVREHPLRERLRKHLMVALYRSGRQAEALDVFRDARRALHEELGLEPGTELQAAQKAILDHDPDLAPPPRVELSDPARAPSDASPSFRSRRIAPRAAVLTGIGLLVLAGAAAAALTLARGGGAKAIVVPPNSVAIVDGKSNRITGFAPVGERPIAVAVGAGAVWVANADDGTVDRLDPKTGRIVRTIGIGADINDVATGFDSVWVADGNDGTVTRIDPSVNQVEQTIAPSPRAAIAADPVFFVATDDRYVWATRGAELLRIDPATNTVTGRLRLGAANALATGGGFVWLTTTSQRLYRVDPRTVAPTGTLDLQADGLALSYGSGVLWAIVTTYPGSVERIDPSTLAAEPAGGTEQGPGVLAVGDGAVWTANGNGIVQRVDTSTGRVVATFRVGALPSAAAAARGRLWLTVVRRPT